MSSSQLRIESRWEDWKYWRYDDILFTRTLGQGEMADQL